MQFFDLYNNYKKKLEKIVSDSYWNYLHSCLTDVEIEHLPCEIDDCIGNRAECYFSFKCLPEDEDRKLKDIIPDEKGKKAYEYLEKLVKFKEYMSKLSLLESSRFLKLLNELFFSSEGIEQKLGRVDCNDQYHEILAEMM